MNFINLIDLYGYDMFKFMVVPKGLTNEIVINTIMDKCALYIPLYTDLELLTDKIRIFFLKHFNTFQRLYDAYAIEYEMINNYDRKENYTTIQSQTAKDIAKYSSNTSQSGTNTSTVSPDDSNSFVNDTQLNTSDNSQLNSNNQVDTTTNNETTHSFRAYGNIGVTTSQQMLESELEVRPKLNIYEIIANFFFKEFVLFTY